MATNNLKRKLSYVCTHHRPNNTHNCEKTTPTTEKSSVLQSRNGYRPIPPVTLSPYRSHPHITAMMVNNKRKLPFLYFCTHHGHNEMHNTDTCRYLHSLGTPVQVQQPHNVQHLVDRARVNVEEQLKLESDVRDNADKGLFRNKYPRSRDQSGQACRSSG